VGKNIPTALNERVEVELEEEGHDVDVVYLRQEAADA
jgi:pyrimidine operon attenuation protein/uracil phosphoribosyltransferase